MAETTHGGARSAASGAEVGRAKQAQQRPPEVKEQANDQTHQAAGQARRTLRDRFDERSAQAGERLTGQGKAGACERPRDRHPISEVVI